MKQFTLSRNERLKSRKQIDRLFNEGKHFSIHPVRVGFIIEPANAKPELQIGVGASGKYFKKAVDRNRIKRLLRECWRLQKTELVSLTVQHGKSLKVFMIYTGRDLPDHGMLYGKVGIAITQLISLFNEKDPAGT